MISLSDIAKLKCEAQDAFESARRAVTALALQHDSGPAAVAALDAAARELAILSKLEFELIAGGRAPAPQTLRRIRTEIDSGASCPSPASLGAPDAKTNSRGAAGGKFPKQDETDDLILSPASDAPPTPKAAAWPRPSLRPGNLHPEPQAGAGRDDESWIDEPGSAAARLHGPGMVTGTAAVVCGPDFW